MPAWVVHAPTEPRSFWTRPDILLSEAGAEGEWLAARIRVVVVTLLLITPLYRYFSYPDVAEYLTGLLVTVAGFVAAIVIYQYLRNGNYAAWVGFASTALDVTLVSIALLSFVITGPPHAAANSRVTFPIYFLAIAATSLRYDKRICVVTGGLAVAQYIAIVVYEGVRWGFNNPQYAPFEYGRVTYADQFNRVVLMIAATILAHALVRRAEHLRRAAVKDLLTDLPNRSYADTRAIAEFSRARRYGQPLTVALLDVDHFKSFNDKYGHATGDRVLRTIADTLRDQLRVSDVVARYGGEEFLVLLPQTEIESATEKIRDLIREVAATPLRINNTAATLTISAGIASYPEDAQELEELLHEADRRLLRAKKEGRNRLVAAAAQHR
jgi:diguanylate cyclase (GGDEF)-like protein